MSASSDRTFLDPSELGNKNYWDEAYEQELNQYLSDSDDEGTIWFSESKAEEKVIEFVEELPLNGAADSNKDNETLKILDVGTGNGHQLFALRDEGWRGTMVGIDYSQASIDLARRIQTSRQCKTETSRENASSAEGDIRFETWDLLRETPSSWLAGAFDLILDKGTFDAISLSDEKLDHELRGCELYAHKIVPLLKDGGFLVITSCNWTAPELKRWFDLPSLTAFSTIKYPQFTFGGKTGQAVTGVCFRQANGSEKV